LCKAAVYWHLVLTLIVGLVNGGLVKGVGDKVLACCMTIRNISAKSEKSEKSAKIRYFKKFLKKNFRFQMKS